jgi:hypothetical protein
MGTIIMKMINEEINLSLSLNIKHKTQINYDRKGLSKVSTCNLCKPFCHEACFIYIHTTMWFIFTLKTHFLETSSLPWAKW